MNPDFAFQPIQSAQLQWIDGIPVASNFCDGYFSRDNGLDETRHVFLHGTHLQEHFSQLPSGSQFVIGETGFGTGLNFLAATQLFLEHAPDTAQLHFVSVEKHPLTREQRELAMRSWVDCFRLSQELLSVWLPHTPGLHRRWFANRRISLTLALGDACDMIERMTFTADAWFLDGFAPSRNPAMWQQRLFDLLAEKSRPGTRLATFTAAGFVRRGLQQAGFEMIRSSGFGRKREMLQGRLPGKWQPGQIRSGQAVIVGAGLAGSSMARALADRGWRISLMDPDGIASQASGNLAGVVYSSASAHPTAQNRFYQSSYLLALAWMQQFGFPEHQDQGVLSGVRQYPANARQQKRFAAAVAAGYWPGELLSAIEKNGLLFAQGGYISPRAWCRKLTDHPAIELISQAVTDYSPGENGWQIHCKEKNHQADVLIFANAGAVQQFTAMQTLPLKLIRGQVSYCKATHASLQWTQALCHSGYLTPAINGQHCAGATFDLHSATQDIRSDDDAENLRTLRKQLPEHWHQLGGENIQLTGQRVGLRCQSRDFLPLAGQADEAQDGLYLDIAHGSRGITSTALCAELIAAQIAGEPLPCDRAMVEALSPLRFR